jgi:hypothetical protein
LKCNWVEQICSTPIRARTQLSFRHGDQDGNIALFDRKWHLGAGAPFHPNRRGFDELFGFTGGGHMYFGEEFPRLLTQRRQAKVVNMEQYTNEPFSIDRHLPVISLQYFTVSDDGAGKNSSMAALQKASD